MNAKLRDIIYKLSCDTKRYQKDLLLKNKLQLFFIIDYWPVFLFRVESMCDVLGFLGKILRFFLIPLRPLVKGLSGSRIFYGAKIGEGLLLHISEGVIIGPEAIIGKDCTFFSGASIVYRADNRGSGNAIIGDNVKLLSGCKVIGSVKIGDNASVGANAVVLTDVPAHTVAVGIPARIIEKT